MLKCKRCNNKVVVEDLPKSYISRKKFSRCNICLLDLKKRRAVKDKILRKLPSERTKVEINFISHFRDIGVKIPKYYVNYLKQQSTSYRPNKGDKRYCEKCNKYQSITEFYRYKTGYHSNSCKKCSRFENRRRRALVKNNLNGHIYILRNIAWDGYYKVGKAKNPDRRLNGYNTGSPKRDYEYVFISEILQKPTIYEYVIEEIYQKYKVDKEYEWYKFDQDTLNDLISFIKNQNENDLYNKWLVD